MVAVCLLKIQGKPTHVVFCPKFLLKLLLLLEQEAVNYVNFTAGLRRMDLEINLGVTPKTLFTSPGRVGHRCSRNASLAKARNLVMSVISMYSKKLIFSSYIFFSDMKLNLVSHTH